MSSDTGKGQVTVIYGVYADVLPVAGWTVLEVRDVARTRMNVPPDARPAVDGEVADDNTVLAADQTLVFVRPAALIGETPIVRIETDQRHDHWIAWIDNRPETKFGGDTQATAVNRLCEANSMACRTCTGCGGTGGYVGLNVTEDCGHCNGLGFVVEGAAVVK